MKHCSNSHCPGQQQGDKPLEYHDSEELCPACGSRLTATDQVVHQPSSPPWKRFFVTVGIVAVYLGATKIALPTVTPTPAFGEGPRVARSIMELGVRPLLSGYLLVELAALLVPVWRPLRMGRPEGRAKLQRASLLVGMLLALFQAVVLAIWLEKMGAATDPGSGFRIITVIALVGATAALVVLARIGDREGLGSGFSILLLAAAGPDIIGPLRNAYTAAQAGAIPTSALYNGAFSVAVLVGATLWLFSPYCLPGAEPLDHPSLVSRPACGMAPLSVVPAVLMVATISTRLSNPGQAFGPQSAGYFATALALSIPAALLFAFLFNPPDRIAEMWRSLSQNAGEAIPRLKAVMLESVLFIALVMLVQAWVVRSVGAVFVPIATKIIIATGILCDLTREWHARRTNPHLTSIWEIHQSYAVAPSLRLLKAEGIHAFAKGMHLRALLQFFGPYIPVQILVPVEDARRANAFMQARWPGGDGRDGSLGKA